MCIIWDYLMGAKKQEKNEANSHMQGQKEETL